MLQLTFPDGHLEGDATALVPCEWVADPYVAFVPREADGSFRVESVLQRHDAPRIGWHDLGVFYLTPTLLSRVAAHALQQLEESARIVPFPESATVSFNTPAGFEALLNARLNAPSDGRSEIRRREEPAAAAAARRF